MTRLRVIRCALVMLTALPSAACAAGPSPRSSVTGARHSAQRFLRALSTEDGRHICPWLSQAARRQLIREAQQAGVNATQCRSAANAVYHRIGRILGASRIKSLKVHGSHARVTLVNPQVSGTDGFRMDRVHRRWLVTFLPD